MSEVQDPNGEAPQAEQVPVTIHAQYVRDLSFENPNAPDSLRGDAPAPQMDINIGMDARKDIASSFELCAKAVSDEADRARQNKEGGDCSAEERLVR